MSAGAARVRVSFQVDADGLLSVTACEQSSGVKASVAVRPSYGLSDDEIATMLQQSFVLAGADRDARALREQQVEADRLDEATRAALAADGDLLSDAERTVIESLLVRVRESRSTTDSDAIRHAVDALARGTENFAAQRMDRAIAKALAGRRIDQLDRS
jgi:molecular chaperone HscA